MAESGPSLGPFEPATARPSPNGSRRRGRRVLRGVGLGFLGGAIVAASLVPRLQWLNLGRLGWWGRPVLAAAVAGAMVGALRRDDRWTAVAGGAVAGLLALWGVYVLLRVSVRVLWVERSEARVISADLVRLSAYAVPAGALASLVAWYLRRVPGAIARRRAARSL